MDQNWLMAALQSPEGMNFLNSWRQRYGGGMQGNTYGSAGSSTPVSRWRNFGGSGGLPGPSPTQPLTVGGPAPNQSFGAQPQSATPQTGMLFGGGSLSIGGRSSNDLSGQQMPQVPYWNPGN